MKNYGIIGFKDANVDNFTSDTGIKLRRVIHPVLRRVLRLAVKGDLIIDRYPTLEKDKPYIFVSLHNFLEDTIANLATIDRSTYLLFGTTNQLELNKEMYAAWLNGFIYVDRENVENRRDAIKKMERVLTSGSSVLIFPEGGFNNTENLLCQKLFASPFILSHLTGIEVVPIAPFYQFGSDKIYMNVGDPIDLCKFDDKKEALMYLRDTLASMAYENYLKHAKRVLRSELGDDPRLDYMEERRCEYLKSKWSRDVWDEELTRYLDSEDKEMESVLSSMDDIKITKHNAYIMKPIIERRSEDKKYDFKKYMHENWNK